MLREKWFTLLYILNTAFLLNFYKHLQAHVRKEEFLKTKTGFKKYSSKLKLNIYRAPEINRYNIVYKF